MTFLPSVVQAEQRGQSRLHVVFNYGTENTIDFSRWLEGPVFERLKNPAFFKRAFVDGGTIAHLMMKPSDRSMTSAVRKLTTRKE